MFEKIKEKTAEIYEDFVDFYYNNVLSNTYYSIKKGVKNIVLYFPTIWQDRQWDYHYIIKILNLKLKLVEEHMKSDKCMKSVNHDKYIKQVQVVRFLTQRIIDSQYLNNATNIYDKEYDWKNFKFEFEPCEDNPKFSRLIDRRTEKQKKNFSKACKYAEEQEDRDYKMLFALLDKNIRKWWD